MLDKGGSPEGDKLNRKTMDPNLITETVKELGNVEAQTGILTEVVRQAGNTDAARLIAKGLCTLTMGGSGIGEGYLIGKAFEAMGRNPEMSSSLFSKMIIGVAMAESTAIYAFVAFFIV